MVRGCHLWVSVVLFGFASAAHAQETREHELPDLEEEIGAIDHLQARLTVANRFVGNADFGAFEATSNQPEARLRIGMPLSQNTVARLMLTGRALLYDFDGSTNDFVPDEPFDNLYGAGLRLQLAHLFGEEHTLFRDDERWAVLVQGGAGSRWEKGANFGDGLKGGGSIAAGYRLGDTLEVAAGISLGSRSLRSGVSISPLLEFDWRINDAWRLRSYGLGLQLERRLGEEFTVFVRSRMEGQSYRLAERTGIGRGSLRVRQVPAALGIDWSRWRFLKIRLLAGAIAYQKMRLRNEDRDSIGSVTADGPSPYVTLRIDLRR